MIQDSLKRSFRNLRISLTGACNYSCEYCVPKDYQLQREPDELDASQLLRLTRLLLQSSPINKVRITGGEPLLSHNFDEFIAGIDDPQITDLALTTNGQLIKRKIRQIRKSRIARVNISLDTLDASKFAQIANGGDLRSVLEGITLLRAEKMRLKVNMVVMRGVNDDQILPLLDYCLDNGIELRFIELMRMGHLKNSPLYEQWFFSMGEILETIAQSYDYSPTTATRDATAVRYKIEDDGVFGIIANSSQPFCRTCTRLRLTSNGQLYGCLSNQSYQDLRPLLDMEDSQALAELQRQLIMALKSKQSYSFGGETTVMKFIGG